MKTILTAVFFCTFSYSYAQNVGIGTTNPQAPLSVGANSQLRVDASGNIIRINDVPYNFPNSGADMQHGQER